MKKKLISSFSIIIILTFILIFPFKQNFVFAKDKVESSAKTMVLIEQNSKRVLLEKYKDIQLPMASTTKIMTAYSVLKRCDNLQTKIKIDNRSVGIEGTSMYLKKDEEISIQNLLYGMMIASGNDASVALALHFSASVEEFALIMNADAKNIGALNSNFTNPHGLDQEGHFTTAYDLALICANAMKFPFFAEMISQKKVVLDKDTKNSRVLVNKNKLLGNYDYCTGGKIGFTDKAGRCLVTTASKGSLNLICVVLNCPDMFMDSRNILEYGFNNYIYTELLEQYKIHRKVIVNDGKEDEVKVYTKRSFFYPLTLDETMSLSFVYDIPNSLDAPIDKEQIVGKFKIYLQDDLIFEDDLYSMDEIKSIKFVENFKDIVSYW